jgi:ribonucleoside-diphosphate reductase alpha chain
MMATLRCDHPDIEEFITAKLEPGELSNFNLSVLVSDDFLLAVRHDDDWELRFPPPPAEAASGGGERPNVAARVVRARDLWRRLLEAAYEGGDPGVLFIDRINRLNNLWYRERLSATNPCDEVPLPAYGACNLGSARAGSASASPASPTLF